MKYLKDLNLTEVDAAYAQRLGVSYELYGKILEIDRSTNHLPQFQQIVSDETAFYDRITSGSTY